MLSQPQRLPLLLYLEWALLAIMVGGELVQDQGWLLVNGIGIAIFAAMGLRLPQHRQTKALYTLLEIALLLLTSLLGELQLIGLWFVVMVIRNCQFLHRPYRLGVTVFAFLAFVALQFHRRHTLNSLGSDLSQELWLAWMFMYGLSLVFLQLLVDTVLSEYHHRHHLSVANNQIRQYATQIEALATTQERNRIAREIHDALGHSLTALNVHLEAVNKLWQVDPPQAQALLTEAQHLAQRALQDVRNSVAALRSEGLADQPLETAIVADLPAAISTLLQDLERTQPLEITSHIALDHPMPAALKIAVYRILQEAITNIIRHAEATAVTLTVQTQDQHLQVLIRDNGKGFEPQQNTTGFGLHSMQERTWAQHGSWTLTSAPGQGCQIGLTFPLASDP